MEFIVGTFNTPSLYTLRFTPPSTSSSTITSDSSGALTVLHRFHALGSHSWLALSPRKDRLYATAWTEPPSVAAYFVHPIDSPNNENPAVGPSLAFINSLPVAARSGYVAVSDTHLYSAGGPTGEVFELDGDGKVGKMVQRLSFVEEEKSEQGKVEERLHGDFGGLRHGAHSVDLSPDGKSLYIADIGRNCVWIYSVDTDLDGEERKQGNKQHLELKGKHAAPRSTDGPRHTTPHPNNRILYSLQEHSSMVDAFLVTQDGTSLKHLHGVKIIPADKDPAHYWADEVRVSNTDRPPKYLYASTRGLKKETKGYVAVFELDAEGSLGECVDMYETETSGGWANAVEPAPRREADEEGEEWLALTDSEEGYVFILGFDGRRIREVARVKLEPGKGEEGVVGAATAVWL